MKFILSNRKYANHRIREKYLPKNYINIIKYYSFSFYF